MKKIYPLLLLFLFLSPQICFSQERVIPLWPDDQIPNFQESDESEIRQMNDILWIENVQKPTLELFLPAKRNATRQAVVIFPGGGYRGLAYDWEGTDIAKWFNSKGIAAFVLKYRLPVSTSVIVPNEAPLQDAKQAIRTVRANAEEWNIFGNQIGIMGFSAGGHLASTLGTHFNHEDSVEPDSINSLNVRPDFMILMYPVITMKEPYTHSGSKTNLLGENPEADLVEYFSNEAQVTEKTPPTFIVHATDDEAVPVENSLMFYKALKEKNISVEMHIYPEGGHGFSLAIEKGYLQTWPDRLFDWLKEIEFSGIEREE